MPSINFAPLDRLWPPVVACEPTPGTDSDAYQRHRPTTSRRRWPTCRLASTGGSTRRPGQCILVIIDATPESKKELSGFTDGLRESAQSWRDLLFDLKPVSYTHLTLP